jgi:hypothetical protein
MLDGIGHERAEEPFDDVVLQPAIGPPCVHELEYVRRLYDRSGTRCGGIPDTHRREIHRIESVPALLAQRVRWTDAEWTESHTRRRRKAFGRLEESAPELQGLFHKHDTRSTNSTRRCFEEKK